MSTIRANDLLVPEDKRIEVMMMVKEGRITVERALERIQKMEKRLIEEREREQREKEEMLARMSAKALKQEKAKQKQLALEQERLKEENKLVISPMAYVTSPLSNNDLAASEMNLSDKERMDVMNLVKSGSLTVDEAMHKVFQREYAIKTNKLLSVSQERRASLKEKKTVAFTKDEAEILETWAPEEYDRSHPDGYDPESSRQQWLQEEEEEKLRQLEDRWAVLEVSLPPGTQCSERIKYFENKSLQTQMETDAEIKKKERRQMERQRSQKNKTKRDWSLKVKRKGIVPISTAMRRAIEREVLQLQEHMCAITSIIAKIERQHAYYLEQQHLKAKFAGLSHQVEMLGLSTNTTDASHDEGADIEQEMTRIRQEARASAGNSGGRGNDDVTKNDDVIQNDGDDSMEDDINREIAKLREDARRAALEKLAANPNP